MFKLAVSGIVYFLVFCSIIACAGAGAAYAINLVVCPDIIRVLIVGVVMVVAFVAAFFIAHAAARAV